MIYLEFWEDDGEIRIGGRAGMVHFPLGEMRARTEIERVFLAGENEA